MNWAKYTSSQTYFPSLSLSLLVRCSNLGVDWLERFECIAFQMYVIKIQYFGWLKNKFMLFLGGMKLILNSFLVHIKIKHLSWPLLLLPVLNKLPSWSPPLFTHCRFHRYLGMRAQSFILCELSSSSPLLLHMPLVLLVPPQVNSSHDLLYAFTCHQSCQYLSTWAPVVILKDLWSCTSKLHCECGQHFLLF